MATLRNLFDCNYDQAQGIRPENICKWRHHVPKGIKYGSKGHQIYKCKFHYFGEVFAEGDASNLLS